MLRTCGGQALPCPAGLPVHLSGVDLLTPPPALSSGSFLPFESWAEARAAPAPTVSCPTALGARPPGSGACVDVRVVSPASPPPCAVPSFRPAHRPLWLLDWFQPLACVIGLARPGGLGLSSCPSRDPRLGLLWAPRAQGPAPALWIQPQGCAPVFASSLGFVSV